MKKTGKSVFFSHIFKVFFEKIVFSFFLTSWSAKKWILSSFVISHKVSQNVVKKQYFSSFFAKIEFPHRMGAFYFVQNQCFLSLPLARGAIKNTKHDNFVFDVETRPAE